MTLRWMFSRFDECDVSALTVKALSEAGYVQMTRVQEATLSVCLDGTFPLSLVQLNHLRSSRSGS